MVEVIKKMKKLSYFVAGLLLFSSFVAIGIGKEAGEVENVNIFDHRDAEMIPFEVIKLREGKRTTGLAGNVLVSIDSEGDDMWPAITQDPDNIVVTWTHRASILESNIGFGYSQDSGGSFTAVLVALDEIAMAEFSDIAYVAGSNNGGIFDGLWGVFGGPMDNIYGFYYMTDITDDTTYAFSSWTGEAPDIAYTAIADHTWYNELNYDYTGPTNMYISDSDLCSLDDCPQHIITGVDDTGAITGGVFYHDCQKDLDTAPAKDCDMECVHDADPAQTLEDFVVLTWQYDDPEEGSKIVFKRIEFDTEPDIEYTPYEGYIGPGTNPNIGASGDNVVVVYIEQDPSLGDQNIKCAYSSDEGDTWEITDIAAEPLVDEMYPAVYMTGSNAYCAYVKQGNLYVVGSDDGGANWGTPEQVNEVDGTVVAEENTVDIHPAGIVWTDNRDGDKDIYYAPVTNAPSKPSTPDGPTEGKTGTSYTYSTSTVDPNGDDVSYGWDWNGDSVVDEWTGFKSSGTPVSTSHTWDAGFTGEIKVKAKDTNDDESLWSDPLAVSMPRSKQATYPVLLQKFLEIFPNAFPLLRYILGL